MKFDKEKLKTELKKDTAFLAEMASKLSETFGKDKVLISNEAKKIIGQMHDETVKLKELAIKRNKEIINEDIPEMRETVKQYFNKKKDTAND